jgi:hypothetical protein
VNWIIERFRGEIGATLTIPLTGEIEAIAFIGNYGSLPRARAKAPSRPDAQYSMAVRLGCDVSCSVGKTGLSSSVG